MEKRNKEKKKEAGQFGLVRGRKGKRPRVGSEYRKHFSILKIYLNPNQIRISNRKIKSSCTHQLKRNYAMT
jgi:hypothetical protein